LCRLFKHADAERLGERERYAGATGIDAKQALRVAQPGDRHPVLGLRVDDAVATGDVAAGFPPDLEATP